MKTNSVQKNIPDEWREESLQSLGINVIDGDRGKNYPNQNDFSKSGYCLFLTAANVSKNGFVFNENQFISKEKDDAMGKGRLERSDVVITTRGTIGNIAYYSKDIKYENLRINSGMAVIRNPQNSTKLKTKFLLQFFASSLFNKEIMRVSFGSAQPQLTIRIINKLLISIPEQVCEQERIVAVLETWDKAIEKLEKKIEIKEKIKKGLMQQLLTGKIRLAGFTDKWKVVDLGDIVDCLDNQRVPLNFEGRQIKQGKIPYCGANGIVDYIDEYIFDEDIILLAEDGGQFEEYQNRPIAYRMKGKCWVNNHAHVIRAKKIFNQDLLFFMTEHKNILKYLNGGTRAKLNKSELLKIKYFVPTDIKEQNAIADILTATESELNLFTDKIEKIKNQKKFLLNNLITGIIRTPEDLEVN